MSNTPTYALRYTVPWPTSTGDHVDRECFITFDDLDAMWETHDAITAVSPVGITAARLDSDITWQPIPPREGQ